MIETRPLMIRNIESGKLNRPKAEARAFSAQNSTHSGKVSFAGLLTAASMLPPRRTPQEDYDQLEHELNEHEELLAQMPLLENFQKYKTAVRKMLDHILQYGVRLRSYEDRKKKHYEYVQIIDSKLGQLLQCLTRRRTDTVIALHLMGEIRGILVNTLR